MGSLAEVEAALRDGEDRAQRDRWRRTPWMLSLEVGDRAKAARLFEAGVDRNERGHADRSAVAVAAIRGDSRLVEWLIDRGFGLEDRDAFGMTPLMHAVSGAHVGVARRLLRRGADIDAGYDEEGLSGKVVSYARGPRMLAALLDAGGDLADTSEEMRRVLRGHRAARAPSITAEDFRVGAARRFGRVMTAEGGSPSSAIRERFFSRLTFTPRPTIEAQSTSSAASGTQASARRARRLSIGWTARRSRSPASRRAALIQAGWSDTGLDSTATISWSRVARCSHARRAPKRG